MWLRVNNAVNSSVNNAHLMGVVAGSFPIAANDPVADLQQIQIHRWLISKRSYDNSTAGGGATSATGKPGSSSYPGSTAGPGKSRAAPSMMSMPASPSSGGEASEGAESSHQVSAKGRSRPGVLRRGGAGGDDLSPGSSSIDGTRSIADEADSPPSLTGGGAGGSARAKAAARGLGTAGGRGGGPGIVLRRRIYKQKPSAPPIETLASAGSSGSGGRVGSGPVDITTGTLHVQGEAGAVGPVRITISPPPSRLGDAPSSVFDVSSANSSTMSPERPNRPHTAASLDAQP